MADSVGKWAKGDSYGPVLSQTDLYLLGVPLELHPILRNTDDAFHLAFDLRSGDVGGFDPANRDRAIPFTQRHQPATLPRVTQLILITKWSPWCTIVKAAADGVGVTLEDVCTALRDDYGRVITDPEREGLKPRQQDQLRRYATMNANQLSHAQPQAAWGGAPYYGSGPAPAPNQYKRYDWLKDRCMFERLSQDAEERYITQRLGFNAKNIYVMELMA